MQNNTQRIIQTVTRKWAFEAPIAVLGNSPPPRRPVPDVVRTRHVEHP